MLTNERNIKLGLGLIGIGREWPPNSGNKIPSEEETLRFLKRSYNLGISHFDTAPSYGLSEERLGNFLKSLKTDELKAIFIATKFGEHWSPTKNEPYVDHTFNALKNSIDQSISRLPKIDLLQLHKTNTHVLQSDDFLRATEYARFKGILYFGASVTDLESAQTVCQSQIFTHIQLPFNIVNTNFIEALESAKKHDKTVVINRPFNMGGVLYGSSSQDVELRRVEAYKFIVRQGFKGIILTGTRSFEHLIENLAAFQRAMVG